MGKLTRDGIPMFQPPQLPTGTNCLNKVFPDAAAPVFADWFSGELHYLSLKFYWGKLVSEYEALQATRLL